MGSGSRVPEKGINLNPDVIATDPEEAGELDYSERTRDNYRRQWELFEDWMGRRGRSALPADPGDAAEYLRWRYEQGRAASTLRQSAGAIAYHHRKAGLPNPCDWLQVRTVLRSLGRKAGKGRGPESPLTDKDLKRIVRTAFKPRPRGAGVETEQRAQHRGTGGHRADPDDARRSTFLLRGRRTPVEGCALERLRGRIPAAAGVRNRTPSA